MIAPTEPTQDDILADVDDKEGSHGLLHDVMLQVQETALELRDMREDRYFKRESVFDVNAHIAYRELEDFSGEEKLLWDEQLDYITRMADIQWEYIYRAVLYSEDRSNWQTPTTQKNGRLGWTEASEELAVKEFYMPNGAKLVWSTDSVAGHMEATDNIMGENLRLPLRGDESLALHVDTDISYQLGIKDRVWIGYDLNEGTHPLPYTEPSPVKSLSLALKSHERKTIPLDEYTIDNSAEERATARAAEAAEQTYASASDRARAVVNLLIEGCLSTADTIRIMQYVTGQRPVVELKYGNSAPKFIAHIADILGANMTHVPQAGRVLMSREPLDDLEYLQNKFPQAQHLVTDDVKNIYRALGYPAKTLIHRLETGGHRGLTLERLAQMYEAGEVLDEDVWFYQLVGYHPAPETECIIEAVREGDRNLASFDMFDRQNGTEFGPHIRNEILDQNVVDWSIGV